MYFKIIMVIFSQNKIATKKKVRKIFFLLTIKKKMKNFLIKNRHLVCISVVSSFCGFENGGREQAGERWNASGEQQHGDERVPGRVVHCSERKVGEAAKRNRSSRGREGLAHQIEQGHEADHVGLEATALRRSRHRLGFGPSRQTQSHLRRSPNSPNWYSH